MHRCGRVVGQAGVDSAVREEIDSRFALTFQLGLAATILPMTLGLTAGAFSALRPYTFVDYLSTSVCLLGVSVPIFWSGLVLVLVFAVYLHWLPSGGTGTPLHLVLSAISLGLCGAGGIARQARSTMLEVLVSDYIRTARAKGLAEWAIVLKHALQPLSLRPSHSFRMSGGFYRVCDSSKPSLPASVAVLGPADEISPRPDRRRGQCPAGGNRSAGEYIAPSALNQHL